MASQETLNQAKQRLIELRQQNKATQSPQTSVNPLGTQTPTNNLNQVVQPTQPATNRLKQAEQRLQEIRSQKTTTKNNLQQLMEQQQIKRNKDKQQKSSFMNIVDKASKPFKTASDFLFGATSKSLGSLAGSGIASLSKKDSDWRKAFLTEKGTPQFFEKPGSAAADIAFTGLELAPGGGLLTKALRKAPGASKIASIVEKQPAKLKQSALDKMTSIFRPTTKKTKAIAEKTLPELMKERKIITSTGKLAEEARGKLKQIGSDIGEFIDTLPNNKKVNVKPILEKLNQFKQSKIINGIVADPTAVKSTDEVIDIIKGLSTQQGTANIKNLRQLRQIFDEGYDITKGSFDDISAYKKKVRRLASDSMRDVLGKAEPDLADLNKQYSFWKNVEILADTASKKGTPKLRPALSGLIGAGVGISTGQGVLGKIAQAAGGQVIASNFSRLLGSPVWKSINVKLKNDLAEALAKDNLPKLQNSVNKILVVGNNLLNNNE